jgi:hypothetical protein
VSSKLSTRARTLSQRRKERRQRGEGVDLSGQDQPMDRESGLWVSASQHQHGNAYDEDDAEEDGARGEGQNGEVRGREEERAENA